MRSLERVFDGIGPRAFARSHVMHRHCYRVLTRTTHVDQFCASQIKEKGYSFPPLRKDLCWAKPTGCVKFATLNYIGSDCVWIGELEKTGPKALAESRLFTSTTKRPKDISKKI